MSFSDKSNNLSFVPSEDSDHHVDSVDLSDWVDAQADLCLCWTHKAQINGFITEQLLFSTIKKKMLLIV